MPIINPQPTHQAGDYPDTIRHISNGDPGNQTFMRNPSIDLEFRTEVLRESHNTFEVTTGANFSSVTSFNTNHDHSGSSGEKLIDFSQIYSNDNQVDAGFSISASGQFYIKKSGGGDDLLRIVEDATLPVAKFIFPGSVNLHAHMAAPASDLALAPHGLKLTGRVFPISTGSYIDGATNGPYTEVVLDPSAAIGLQFSATGLVAKAPSDGVTVEGVLVGDLTSPGGYKDNVILIHDDSTGNPILSGLDPVYGLLRDTNPSGAPVWELSFFANGTPYSFATDKTIRIYGQEAFSLSNTNVVNSNFVLQCQTGVIV